MHGDGSRGELMMIYKVEENLDDASDGE